METLAKVVFERTPLGAVAIKSTGDEVPRRLRTLLLAVDGRSPVSQYVPFLTAFAPLSEKFSELEKLGYLRRKGAVDAGVWATAQYVAPPLTRSGQAVGALASGPVPLDEAALIAFAASLHHQNAAPAAAAPAADAFSFELQALSRQFAGVASTPVATSHLPVARAEVPGSIAPTVLSKILDAMQQFLSGAAGLDGLPIVMMLEQIRTLDQLRSEMPSYVELIRPYGEDAELHLGLVAQMLDEAGRSAAR